MVRKLFAFLDTAITWIERIRQIPGGVYVVSGAMTLGLAVLQWMSGQPVVVMVPLVIVTFAALVYLMLNLGAWRDKINPLPFAVIVPSIGQTDGSIQAFLVAQNRQASRRLSLHFEFCFLAANGHRDWFRPVELDGVQSDLGGDEHTEGMVRYLEDRRAGNLPEPETGRWFLRISDMVSGRRVLFVIPGPCPGPGVEHLRHRSHPTYRKVPGRPVKTVFASQESFDWKNMGVAALAGRA